MKTIGLASAVAGLALLAISGAARAAPAGTAMPNLATLSLGTLSAENGAVEKVEYMRWRHRRCGWVRVCGPYRCHWVRRCY